jgi:hypothetical protein
MNRLFGIGLAALAAAALGQPPSQTDASASSRVLLAYESTRFKDQLVSDMEDLLTKEQVAVDLVDHQNGGLDSADLSAYDAIFITSSGVKSQIRPWIVTWLDAHEEVHDKTILHVTQTRDWTPQSPVDAVTSASAMKRASALAGEYVGRLRAIYRAPATDSTVSDGQ